MPSPPPTERAKSALAHRLALCLALLALLCSSAPATAATLEDVLIFLGQDHARLLLVLDAPAPAVQTRSTPAFGQAPARAMIMLPGTVFSPALLAAYHQRPAGTEMPVDQAGVQRLVYSKLGSAAQVAVELDGARDVSVRQVGRRALLVDLQAPEAFEDSSLPDKEALALWLVGLSFVDDGERRPHPRPRIVVDAGHGGHDPGAVGGTGTEEADIVLALARMVATGLERELDAEIILTRDKDEFISLQDRAAMANARDADLFLSIHANAAPSSELRGVETYYLDVASDEGAARVAMRENASGATGPTRDPTARVVSDLVISGTSALSRKLAYEVHEAVIAELNALFGAEQVRDLGVKSAVFYVLVSTRMPSILFEASFVSNPDDELRLRTPAFQRATADAVVRGVKEYLQQTEKK